MDAHAPIRALLVDDVAAWRRSVRSILTADQYLRLIREVADGWEAVQATQELQPDLILLDISLPSLNGIEAAVRINQAAPKAKVLFLTMHSDPDVVHTAMSNRAHGYVLKTDAEAELLPAIRSVLRGEKFLSSGLRM